MLVGVVVGQLDLLERNHLAPQLVQSERPVWVQEEARRRGRVRLARLLPRGLVVGVTVALLVVGQDVHEHLELVASIQAGLSVRLAGRLLVEGKVDSHRWEHAPVWVASR